jgi:threonine aldolase
MSDLLDRFRAASATADWIFHRPPSTPAAMLRELADHAEANDLAWDRYGERGAVAQREAEVAELLGKPAAVMFPSGVMAQQATLRAWCDRAGSRRVALPDLSHLVHHEQDGPRRVLGLELEWLTTGRRTATADDLAAVGGRLGAAMVELPLRDAGCLLPTWDELVELSVSARERGVPLHADGARIWESQPFYDRPLPEIAGLFDSMYVSFYKGLGAPAGAAVVGEQDAMDELRGWRQRMGGQLHHLTPYAVPALLGLRDRLPRMGEYVAWARAFAGELVAAGLRVNPSPPHINTFEVFADAPLHDVKERLAGLMEREKVQPCGSWRETAVPGVSTTEVSCYDAALAFDPAKVAAWYAEMAGL